MGSNMTGTVSLAEVAQEYIKSSGVTITEIAAEIGCSRTSVSRVIGNKYEPKSSEVVPKLAEYLQTKLGAELMVAPVTAARVERKTKFFESRDAKAVLGVCQYCQEYGEMGIITGRSGYGKTFSLKQYAKLPRVAYIECDVTMSPRDLLKEIEKALGIPSTYGTNRDRENGIIDFLTINPGYLLILDEADKLMSKYSFNKMHIIRAIFDRTAGQGDYSSCGLVIAGEPSLEAQIKKYLDQYANRNLAGTELRGLNEQEIEEYLADYEIEPEALSELKVRGRNQRTGCFRLLDRTMRNVFRILSQTGGDAITLKIIEQASAMMML